MARGWESKSVESQIEDRAGSRERVEGRSREELERESKRHSIEMSRQRIARELETARNEAHRIALQNALRHLDAELRKLEG
jgi:hypothetical protein